MQPRCSRVAAEIRPRYSRGTAALGDLPVDRLAQGTRVGVDQGRNCGRPLEDRHDVRPVPQQRHLGHVRLPAAKPDDPLLDPGEEWLASQPHAPGHGASGVADVPRTCLGELPQLARESRLRRACRARRSEAPVFEARALWACRGRARGGEHGTCERKRVVAISERTAQRPVTWSSPRAHSGSDGATPVAMDGRRTAAGSRPIAVAIVTGSCIPHTAETIVCS